MLTAIKKLINPEVVLNIATGDKQLIIKESARDSKIKKLFIESVPENSFAFTLDHPAGGRDNRMYKQLSCYLDISEKYINKGSDLILLLPEKGQGQNHYTVLIFDLKSRKPDLSDTEKQLLNSELFIRYLMTLAQCHYGVDTHCVNFKRAIVTMPKRNGNSKSSTYRPNDKKTIECSFKIEPVRVNYRKEAHVNLGALLR